MSDTKPGETPLDAARRVLGNAAEIACLRAPPSADAMEAATELKRVCWGRFVTETEFDALVERIVTAARAALFVDGEFTAHSGGVLPYKIDCDALSDASIATLAKDIARRVKFGSVTGVPRGGDRLAWALRPYITEGAPPIVVDDVLTTGGSMREAWRDDAAGVVIFARGVYPDWVSPLWVAGEVAAQREAAARAEAIEAFAVAILHGDEQHRQWLRGAAADFIAGRPIRALAAQALEDRPSEEELFEVIKPLWLAASPSLEAQRIRSELSRDFDDPKYKQWMSDFIPDYVWSLVDIAAQRGDAAGRADERRKAIEEAVCWIEEHVTAPRLGDLPAALRALATKEAGDD